MDLKVVTRVADTKNLGVTFDEALSFAEHVDAVAARSMKFLGFVIGFCAKFNSVPALTALYRAIVLSILRYTSVVWSPLYGESETATFENFRLKTTCVYLLVVSENNVLHFNCDFL